MSKNLNFDVIIIGGSYAGLSAAMALGRAIRKVLVIDAGNPCNSQTPHSHNFLTQDGATPTKIAEISKAQVQAYPTVSFENDFATDCEKTASGFEIKTASGNTYNTKKLILATGIKDIMPKIDGYAACWGISIIHCPYCHGYEVRNEKTGIFANGEAAMNYVSLIRNWTKELTVFSNGKSTFTKEQHAKLANHGVEVIEDEISKFIHKNGKLESVKFKDNSQLNLKVMYARTEFELIGNIIPQLGIELNDLGLIKVDITQKTNVPGVYACGDCANMLRSVAFTVSTGNLAGGTANHNLTEEEF